MSTRVLLLPLVLGMTTAALAQEESTDRSDASSSAAADISIAASPAVADPVLSSAEAKTGARNRLMEEVLVTAQKREENVQDVPISIAAYSAEQLDAVGADETKDLVQITPGFTYTEFAGYPILFLRGVGTDNFIPSADPSIATYVDGIYFPVGQGSTQNFGAVERVEVLKGPQGTLFGRNSTGGAISVTTKTPGPKPETSIQVSAGNYDDYKARVYTNVPLANDFAVSLSGLYTSKTFYYDVVNDSPRALPKDLTKGFRLKAHWSPLEDLDVTLTAQRIDQSGASSLTAVNVRPSPILGAAITPQPDNYTVAHDSDTAIATHNNALYGNVTWQLPWFDLKLLGSDQILKQDYASYDYDGSPVPLVNFYTTNEYLDFQTAEMQFVSNATSLDAEHFKWAAGLFYLKSKAGYDPIRFQVLGSVLNRLPHIPGGLGELIGGLPAPIPDPTNVNVVLFGLLGTRSYSAYAQGTYTFTDWMDLTLGGRAQRETRSLLKSSAQLDAIGGGTVPTPLTYDEPDRTVTNFSPKVSLEFHPADDLLVYLSWQKGFKSQTYNIINLTKRPQYVKPEDVTAYELGAKSELFNHNLRINGAIFQSQIRNLQSAFISLVSGGVVNFQNAGEARIRGAEFDTLWVPMPELNSGLVLTVVGAYLDGIYTDYKNGFGYDETTGLFFDNRDFSGNRVVRTPKFSGTLALSQSIDTAKGPLELAAGLYYSSSFYFTAQNAPYTDQPAYEVLNTHASYLYAPWNVRLTLYGDNVLDKKYLIGFGQNDFGIQHTLAPPVTYGVRVNWDF